LPGSALKVPGGWVVGGGRVGGYRVKLVIALAELKPSLGQAEQNLFFQGKHIFSLLPQLGLLYFCSIFS
jgi:hypothetical protein